MAENVEKDTESKADKQHSQYVVKFVKPGSGASDEELKNMRNGFQGMGKESYGVSWISEEDCQCTTVKDRSSIFVFHSFQSAAFEHLKKTGNRIYGIMCILAGLKTEKTLPRDVQPIWNAAMLDTVVSCTSVDKATREEVYKKVTLMGGKISKDFNDHVTHLVAGEVGSKKYLVAASLKKKVMTPEWVQKVWERSQQHLIHGDDDEFSRLKCPMFRGLVITVSGLDSVSRENVKRLVHEEGGRYSGEMKITECTHLLINEPKGQKYEFAKKWKIHIVKPEWLHKCLEEGYCLDEAHFKVEADGKSEFQTSTPAGSRASRLSHLSDVSTISNMSAVTHLNETTMSIANQSRMSIVPDVDPLEALDVSTCHGDMFLDGCKIFLSGFAGPKLEKLRRIINMGGGTRFNQINDSVSHVVVGERINSHIKQLQEASFRPHVVGVEWMLECLKQGSVVSEEPFQCLDVAPPDPTSPQFKGLRMKKPTSGKGVSKPAPSTSVPPKTDSEGQQRDMQDLMSQYLPHNDVPDMTNDSTLMQALAEMDMKSGTNDSTLVHAVGHVEPANEKQPMDDEETQDPCGGQGGLLEGKTFMIFGFDAEERAQLVEIIEQEHSGQVVTEKSRVIPDYALVPLSGCEVKATVGEVVTNAWLQMCAESEELLPVSSNQLFTPLVIQHESEPLKGCVLSVSGFVGTERDALMHVAELLGATCQEFFVKTAKNNLLASTHLVVNTATGSKYQAAKKWKLPAVSKYWLLESARTGRQCPEEDFLIDKPQKAWNQQHKESENPPKRSSIVPEQSVGIKDTNRKSVEHPKDNVEALLGKNQGNMNNQDPDETVDNMDTTLNRSDKENETLTPKFASKEDNVAEKEPDVPVPVPVRLQTPVLRNNRVKELIIQTKTTPKEQSLSATPGSDNPTPGKFLDPHKEFFPSFDVQGMLAAVDSPCPASSHKTTKRRKSSLPLDELVQHHLDKAVQNSMVPSSRESLGGTQPQPSYNDSTAVEQAAGPLKDVIIFVGKKLVAQQSDLNNLAVGLGGGYTWSYDSSCTHFVFEGQKNDKNAEFRKARRDKKIIVSPLWLYKCQEENSRVDEALYTHDYKAHHSLVVKENTPRSFRRSNRLHKASPAPPKPPSFPADAVLEEAANDGFEVETVTSDVETAKTAQGIAMEQEEQIEQQSGATPGPSLEVREAFIRQLGNIMEATKNQKQCVRKNRRTSSIDLNNSENGSENNRSRPSSRQKRGTPAEESESNSRRNTRSSNSKQNFDVHTEASQSVSVTWEDPMGREEQEKIGKELKLNLNSESLSPRTTSDEHSGEEAEHYNSRNHPHVKLQMQNVLSETGEKHDSRPATPEAPSIAFPLPRKSVDKSPAKPMELVEPEREEQNEKEKEEAKGRLFLLSGLSPQERDEYGALVEQLGGQVCEAPHYDRKCTHLVVGNPTRNEKYLASVASGKWVLYKSYFEACREKCKFVSEEEHEWGSQAAEKLLSTITASASTVKLALAAHRWRLKLQQMREEAPDCQGAFEGWRVIILTDRGRQDGFKRLLQAGGAVVIATRPPFEDLANVTHAFMDLHKIKEEPDLAQFVSLGVQCLKPEYIAAYLTEDPLPEPQQYFVDKVIPLLPGVSGQKRGTPRKRNLSSASTPTKKRSRYH